MRFEAKMDTCGRDLKIIEKTLERAALLFQEITIFCGQTYLCKISQIVRKPVQPAKKQDARMTSWIRQAPTNKPVSSREGQSLFPKHFLKTKYSSEFPLFHYYSSQNTQCLVCILFLLGPRVFSYSRVHLKTVYKMSSKRSKFALEWVKDKPYTALVFLTKQKRVESKPGKV